MLLLMALQPSSGPGRLRDIFPLPRVQRPMSPSSIPSIHLRCGFPALLHASGLKRVFLKGLSCNIRLTWPTHCNLSIFIV
jgi:hypothetical protein